MVKAPILKSKANCWDGFKQLPGVLEIWPTKLIFHLSDFSKSHLNLCIPFEEIEEVTPFLIFNIAKYGLRIECKNGKVDCFITEDCKRICEILRKKINGASSKF